MHTSRVDPARRDTREHPAKQPQRARQPPPRSTAGSFAHLAYEPQMAAKRMKLEIIFPASSFGEKSMALATA